MKRRVNRLGKIVRRSGGNRDPSFPGRRRVAANQGERGWTLSRLWVMGHLGGVPNV